MRARKIGTLRERSGEDYAIRVVAPHGDDTTVASRPLLAGAVTPPAIDGRATLAVLDRVHVPSLTGRPVALSQIADLPFEASAPLVQRRNGERIVTVTAQIAAGHNTERVTAAVERQLASITTPPGYRMVIAGEREARAESFGGLGSAILVAVFGILGILVLEFRTFKSTLIVATVIPLGFVGGITFLCCALALRPPQREETRRALALRGVIHGIGGATASCCFSMGPTTALHVGKRTAISSALTPSSGRQYMGDTPVDAPATPSTATASDSASERMNGVKNSGSAAA